MCEPTDEDETMLDINFYRKFHEYFNSLDPEANYTADEIMGGGTVKEF